MVGDQQMPFLLCYDSQSNYSLCVNLRQYGFSSHNTMISVSLAQVCDTEEMIQCHCSVIPTEKKRIYGTHNSRLFLTIYFLKENKSL